VSGVGSTLTASGGVAFFNNAQALNVAGLVISGGGLVFSNTGGASSGSLNLTGGSLAGTSLVTITGPTISAAYAVRIPARLHLFEFVVIALLLLERFASCSFVAHFLDRW
jgi:hypothetical protein